MKHMVINTHNAESCGFRSEEDGKVLGGALDAFGKSGAEFGLTVDEFWVNRSAHAFFILVDAPNAHVIDEALLKAGLVARTHTEVFPVLTMDEVRAAAEKQAST
jgi:uncharacterized protein with GYD domain